MVFCLVVCFGVNLFVTIFLCSVFCFAKFCCRIAVSKAIRGRRQLSTFFFQTNDVRLGVGDSEPVRLEEKSAVIFFFFFFFWTWLEVERSSSGRRAGRRANATRG